MNYEALMRDALALAIRGRGYVEPNPRVGAIALQDGDVVGAGFHEFYGGPHAEVVALLDAEERGKRPDTLVVTLEPCSSPPGRAGKKTPPCTEAILRAGIRRVVIGRSDPDPRHLNEGEAQLKDGGVDVVIGVLEQECTETNRPFNRWLGMDVPWVIAKWAMSLDGKTATREGDSKWISSQDSRTLVHGIRSHVDAVMVGFQTAVQDDPALTVRYATGDNPVRVVVDPVAALPLDRQLVQTARDTPTFVIVGPAADTDRVAALERLGVTVVSVGGVVHSRDLDLVGAMRELRSRGMRRVLLEGGGSLTAACLEAGLIHQAMAFVAPKLIGGTRAKTPVDGPGKDAVLDAWQFGELHSEQIGEDVILHAFAT